MNYLRKSIRKKSENLINSGNFKKSKTDKNGNMCDINVEQIKIGHRATTFQSRHFAIGRNFFFRKMV